MDFLIHYSFSDGARDLLEKTRPHHRRHIEEWSSKILLSALVTDESGEKLKEALFVLGAPSMEDAERFSADDPYVKAGIFQDARISRFIGRRGWT